MPSPVRLFGLLVVGMILWQTPNLRAAEDQSETPIPVPKAPVGKATKLFIYPKKVELDGPRAEQRLIVVGEWPDGRRWDLTRTATFSTGKADIATVTKQGLVLPAGDGQGTITVSAAGVSQPVPVEVKNAKEDRLVSFNTEIQPIMTRFGCNSGGCHGSQHGRGGFRLSLFGFDSEFDYEQIVLSNEGRRVVVSDPERSIVLAKPSLNMEHGGGEKLKLNSREYVRVRQWLEDGAPGPKKDEPKVERLEVFPPYRVMTPGEQQQLAVTAIWSNGIREDVTPLAQFDPVNDGIAGVTNTGLITAKAVGESHVMIRFGGKAEVSQVTLPYGKLASFPKLTPNNFIDEKLQDKWKQLGLTPSPLASEEEFLRRLYLDVIGTLPTPAEVKAFKADRSPALVKRQKVINHVLSRPEFVDWWALKWGDLLRIDRQALQEKGMWSFHNWIRAQLRDEVPVDEFVRKIVTAEGSTFTEGPANFFKVGSNAEDWAETTSQVFLGVRVGCAKCHHHPFEIWSQDDFYSFAAYFGQIGRKGRGVSPPISGDEEFIYTSPTPVRGGVKHPLTDQVMSPKPLLGETEQLEADDDPRVKLAAWMTSPENPYFSKVIVNRVWAELMGRGIVDPVDDLRATNPPSNGPLLDALADDFKANGYDLKKLIKTITMSYVYGLSSVPNERNAGDGRNYSRHYRDRLRAEILLDAVSDMTGVPESFSAMPPGSRSMELWTVRSQSLFLDSFGRPDPNQDPPCERTSETTVVQALHLMNAPGLHQKVTSDQSRASKWAASKMTSAEIVEEAYLWAYSRFPDSDELETCVRWLEKSETKRRQQVEDLLWALINTPEFVFKD